jgi:hypothetical protein
VGAMDFMPFFTRYKELAEKETRTITITRKDIGVPPGEYGLIEYYCTDDRCDCRKVMINVTSSKPPHEILATIGYGWESTDFYTKWMHGDAKTGKEMTGAYLEAWGTQSKYAQKFLELFETTVLSDEYVDRLERHYAMFKSRRTSSSPSRNSNKRKKRKRSGKR